MQENLIKNAVQFLKNPKVAGTDKEKLITFLKSKGLNDDEIQEAFKRVDSPSSAGISLSNLPSAPNASALPVQAQPVPLPLPHSHSQSSTSTLNQSSCNLSSFPEIRFLHPIKTLLLSHNLISQLPKEIIQLSQLETLDLSFNKLTDSSFPISFFSLLNLKTLNLAHNSLTSLDHFSSLINLERLYLNNNLIKVLPEELFDLSLQVLIISFNQLRQLPQNLLQNPTLSQINLAGNPLPAHLLKASYESLAKLKETLLS